MENLNTKQINNKNMILDLHMLEIVRIFVVRHFYITSNPRLPSRSATD